MSKFKVQLITSETDVRLPLLDLKSSPVTPLHIDRDVAPRPPPTAAKVHVLWCLHTVYQPHVSIRRQMHTWTST